LCELGKWAHELEKVCDDGDDDDDDADDDDDDDGVQSFVVVNTLAGLGWQG